MKKIVINADDFGLCDSINQGIMSCMENGIVSDLSFIVNPPNMNYSIELLKRKKIANIGVHLNYTMGKPIKSWNSSLTNSNGYFCNTNHHFINYLKGKLNIEEIYAEGKSQLDILVANGFNISHFDTHQNIHILPPFYEAVERLRQEYSPEAFIRIPYEKIGLASNYKISNWKRIFVLNMFTRILKIKYGMQNTIQTIGGDFFNNNSPEIVFENIIEKIGNSKIEEFELAVHPGFISEEISNFDTYISGREIELKYLSIPNKSIEKHNIKIVNFMDLMRNKIS